MVEDTSVERAHALVYRAADGCSLDASRPEPGPDDVSLRKAAIFATLETAVTFLLEDDRCSTNPPPSSARGSSAS